MSDLSDHTVYCIIITGQCQVFSFEWAFFSDHECDVLMSPRLHARNGRQSSQIALYAFFFRRLIFGTGSPVLAAHRRGVFGSLDCFAGFFAALAGAPLTSVVYYLILNE